jgi:hypothetical protein
MPLLLKAWQKFKLVYNFVGVFGEPLIFPVGNISLKIEDIFYD